MIRLLTTFVLIAGTLLINAQINPRQGAKINYTQVMFECEKVKGADIYLFQLTDSNDTEFNHFFLQQKDSSTATLISGLKFGTKYLWRYAGLKAGQPPVWKGPYHFEIISDQLLDYNLLTLAVTKNDSTANAGGLIINDCTHSIIDRNGNMVWYLPKITWHPVMNKKMIEMKPQIMDMRLTPAGTVTCLVNTSATETDLDGNKLWTAPDDGQVSGSNTEFYNHNFERLPNGHYMVLGGEQWRKLPAYKDTAAVYNKYPSRKVINGHECGEVELPTIMEYDKNGHVTWSWNSESYFDPNVFDTTLSVLERKPHVNAFSVDKKDEFVYMGFRNISRIIKIEKKTGKVVDCWGDKSTNPAPCEFVELHRQHGTNILDDGTIAVFNNNDYPDKDTFACVLFISQQPSDSSKNYIAWKFPCDFDSLDRHINRSGGNVEQLKNGNFLICTGNMNRILEVTRNKKIVWEATLTSNGKAGQMFFHRLYRSHYISSLYPCYFTFQTDDKLKEGQSHFNIKIFNKGSESDAYNVKVYSSSGDNISNFTTAGVEANGSLKVEIKSGRPFKSIDQLVVMVTSKTNPALERQTLITIEK